MKIYSVNYDCMIESAYLKTHTFNLVDAQYSFVLGNAFESAEE